MIDRAKICLASLAATLVLAAAPAQAIRNDCAIVATEATARLLGAGVWTREFRIVFVDPKTGEKLGHAMTVWQPPTSKKIHIYDEAIIDGTWQLDTESTDIADVVRAFMLRSKLVVVSAHYVS